MGYDWVNVYSMFSGAYLAYEVSKVMADAKSGSKAIGTATAIMVVFAIPFLRACGWL